MAHPPVVTNDQIACALSVSESTLRCARLVCDPNLPFERFRGADGRRTVRAYHVRDVIAWLQRVAPQRCTPAVEADLYCRARANEAKFEAAQ